MENSLELVCPAGTPDALKVAVDSGADAVYIGFSDGTNARNFAGLNFSYEETKTAVKYAHKKGVKVYIAINTYPTAGNVDLWKRAIDNVASSGADTVILADIGLLKYAAEKHPDLRRHLSVQASASNATAIRFYAEEFGVKRVVLPRVLTIEEITELDKELDGIVETEVFAFGGVCPMAEGRCALSWHSTGHSPNQNGVCSPASFVKYTTDAGGVLTVKLGDYTLNKLGKGEAVGYPTTCKGRYLVGGEQKYLFEEPESLNAIDILPEFMLAGVKAIKIEGRQRGKAYIKEVVSTFRKAIDNVKVDTGNLSSISEGGKTTRGTYKGE